MSNKNKQQKNLKKPENEAVSTESGWPIPLYIPNLIGYLRFFTIVPSWYFALSDPRTFSYLYVFSYILGAIDGPIAKILGQQSFYGAQLDILMSRFATSSLIFVVLKLGLANIAEEFERMSFAFMFGCLFLSDFVSYWFQVYSSYLLDEESHICPIPIVQLLLQILRLPFINLGMTFLAEFFVFDRYMNFFGNEFKDVYQHPYYNIVKSLALYGLIVKHTHNVLHLLVSSIRIVKLDVAQKNQSLANNKKKN